MGKILRNSGAFFLKPIEIYVVTADLPDMRHNCSAGRCTMGAFIDIAGAQRLVDNINAGQIAFEEAGSVLLYELPEIDTLALTLPDTNPEIRQYAQELVDKYSHIYKPFQ